MKNFLRVLSIALLVSNIDSIIKAGGDEERIASSSYQTDPEEKISVIDIMRLNREQMLASATGNGVIQSGGSSGLMYHYPTQSKDLQKLLLETSPASAQSLIYMLLKKQEGEKKSALFSGAKGVGKTSYAAFIASFLKRENIVINCALLSTEV